MPIDPKKLIEKYGYWGTHPDKHLEDWQNEVANDYTRLGYWEWVSDELFNSNGDM